MDQRLRDRVAESLRDLGIQAGDTLLIHSDFGSLVALCSPERLSTRDIPPRGSLLAAFHGGISEVIGKAGTVAVPGFYYDYARFNRVYDLQNSPPDRNVGIHARYAFEQYRETGEGSRSLNPICNLLAQGPRAAWICEHRSAIGYGETSPWARLTECRAKMVFWGVDLECMTYVHQIEHAVGVPHLYNKLHGTPVIHRGQVVRMPVCSTVRYLNYGIVYRLARMSEALASQGAVRSIVRGRFHAHQVSCADVRDHLTTALGQDPFYLLEQVPRFEPGKIPFDGATGPYDRAVDVIPNKQ